MPDSLKKTHENSHKIFKADIGLCLVKSYFKRIFIDSSNEMLVLRNLIQNIRRHQWSSPFLNKYNGYHIYCNPILEISYSQLYPTCRPSSLPKNETHNLNISTSMYTEHLTKLRLQTQYACKECIPHPTSK